MYCKTLHSNENALDKKIRIIGGCIEKLIEGDKVYTSKDFTPGEMKTFLEGLTQAEYSKLEQFINNFPQLVILADATCNKCGFVHKLKYDDFDSFFF